MAVNDTYPGYGFMLKNGATAVWEHWTNSDSHIHYFMGFVDNFLTRQVAGINVNEDKPGFTEILFTPTFINELNHAEASYESIQGNISIQWERQDSKSINVELVVPCNATGKLVLPGNNLSVKDDKEKILKIENNGTINYVLLPSGKLKIKIVLK